MSVKKELRGYYKAARKNMRPAQKILLDKKICENFLNSDVYCSSQTVLFYVSIDDEIDTTALIDISLENGKNVAVPKCINGTGEMEFHFIKSRKDLEKGVFGIGEPNPSKCVKVVNFTDALCVVPGLCFDKNGYRIGHGHGYYDRFLSRFDGFKIGLCYENNLIEKLPYDEYDQRVDLIITERKEKNV